MIAKERNEVIEEYIKFLEDKGRIVGIKDTSKALNIKLSTPIIYYFLFIISIISGIALIFGGRVLLKEEYEMYDGTNINSTIVALLGMFLFWLILVGVTIYEKKNLKFDVSYPSDEIIKINKKTFDIKKDVCKINIFKFYESLYNSGVSYISNVNIKYKIGVTKNNKTTEYFITDGTEEEFKDFIFNFEYEISDTKKESKEFVQQTYEKLYEEV